MADGSSWYFPIRHGIENGKQILPPEEAAHNMDSEQVCRFLSHVLNDRRPKVGANLIYDLGWAIQSGIAVDGPMYDVQFAEALLDSEAPDVALDSLGERYLGVGKETSILYDWLASWCGGRATDRQRANLYLSPPSLAGPYAEADSSLPIRILERQWPLMAKRGVLELFDLECRLIPLLVKMRLRGAPVNMDYAQKLHDDLGEDLKVPEARLRELAGQPVNPNARDSIKSAFERLGIPLPTKIDKKTGEVKTSFSADLLEEIDHPLCKVIVEYRQIEKVRNTFVKGYILDKNVNGRIYCSFHPLRGAGSGARSGRFSSSDPNLQNIPVRTEIGKKVRKAFQARAGARWRKYDYSQIEYRMLAHHAVGEGAEQLRQIFINDPKADYHEVTIALIKKLTGVVLERRPAKNINFGLIYGMSESKLAGDLGLSQSAGKELFKNYHAAAPFARATMEAAANEVHRLGYVETIMGRKSDFARWSKKGWGEDRALHLDYEAACKKWGPYNIERAFTHKALNRKLQGGAADVMKRAMVTAYEAGMFESSACGMPSLTVHDELDFEDEGDADNPAWDEFVRIMENSMPGMKIPIRIDGKSGPNWGEAD
ncbi:MAG: DNA polymerase [Beijerinckiaceae bacterium]